ncbi:hypothetical protein ACSSS7_001445 [Eimeria intestinalis]
MVSERPTSSSSSNSNALAGGAADVILPAVGHSSSGSSSNNAYFSSYGDPRVHALMLGDKPRVAAYASAMASLSDLIRGKVVLDVGAGSGVLSFFAAAAGAATVLAVEACSAAAELLQQQVRHNEGAGLVRPGVISVFSCSVEELPRHPSFRQEYLKGVDVIVSEWMGFYLLHESMLQSVLHARDTFLKPISGLLLPCRARLLMSLCCCGQVYADHHGFLENYCGFSFVPLQQQLQQQRETNPLVLQLGPDCCCCSPAAVAADLDLYTVTPQQLQRIQNQVTLRVHHRATVYAFAFWFDVTFPGHPQTPPAEAAAAAAPDGLSPAAAAAAAAAFPAFAGPPRPRPTPAAAARLAAAEAAVRGAPGDTGSSSRVTIEHAAAAANGAAAAAAACLPVEPTAAVAPCSRREVTLDTSPFAAPTHWHQLLLLLQQPLDAPEGLELTVEVSLDKDTTNPRCYKVSVDVLDAQTTPEDDGE